MKDWFTVAMYELVGSPPFIAVYILLSKIASVSSDFCFGELVSGLVPLHLREDLGLGTKHYVTRVYTEAM